MDYDKQWFFENETKRLSMKYINYDEKCENITITITLITGIVMSIFYYLKYPNPKDMTEVEFFLCLLLAIFVTLIVYGLTYRITHIILSNSYGSEAMNFKKGDEIPDCIYCYDVLSFFEENYYPKDYTFKKIFREVFESNFRRDNDKFKTWVKEKKFTTKELYIKLLSKQNIQDEIWEKMEEEAHKEYIKKRNETEAKLKNEIKITTEIEEYFR